MDRRKFLSLATAASVAPAIPLPAARAGAVAAAGYNRFTYGLAVFHARTRASLSVADLSARLKVSAVQAEALIGEMTTRGVVTPAANAAAGVVRAVNSFPQAKPAPGTALRKAAEWLTEDDAAKEPMPEQCSPDPDPGHDGTPIPESGETASETDPSPAPAKSSP